MHTPLSLDKDFAFIANVRVSSYDLGLCKALYFCEKCYKNNSCKEYLIEINLLIWRNQFRQYVKSAYL